MSPAASKRFIALLGIFIALSSAGCLWAESEELAIADINPRKVKDGAYEGEQVGDLVSAKVEVVVKNGAITEIKLLKHRHGPWHGANAIVGRVIAAQSLEVDVVSGATSSSKVILKAIEKALEKGL